MAKSTKPTVRVHNSETDEVIDREMNDAEFAQYQIDLAETLAKQADIETRKTERQAILDRLGITAEEAALLLS